MPQNPKRMNIQDLEHAKFDTNDRDEIIIRTSAEGTFQPTGLKEGGAITEVVLSDTIWTALPPVGLTNRRQINIQNLSGTEIKINYSDTIIGYVGIVLPSGGERQYLLEQNVIMYAKAQAGSPVVNVEEIA
jgi:hypothetical protein